jgi:hypothetical protein
MNGDIDEEDGEVDEKEQMSSRAMDPQKSVVDQDGKPLGTGWIPPDPSLGAQGRSAT